MQKKGDGQDLMVRKLLVLTGSCLVIVTLSSVGDAVATPTKYPPCNTYGNQFGIFDFTYDGFRDRAYVLSGSNIHALICGAAPDPVAPSNCENGIDTMHDYIHIYYPPGSRITSTDSAVIPEYSYAGSSDSWFIGVLVCDGYITSDGQQKVRTVDPDNTEAQPECADNGDGEVTACYKIDAASSFLGYMAVRRVLHEGQERLRFEINKPRTDIGEYSIVETTLAFCNYFGQPQGQRCGTGGEPTAFNGAPSAPDCSDGHNGIFRARVHRPLNGGEWSNDTVVCEPWVDFGRTDFQSTHML